MDYKLLIVLGIILVSGCLRDRQTTTTTTTLTLIPDTTTTIAPTTTTEPAYVKTINDLNQRINDLQKKMDTTTTTSTTTSTTTTTIKRRQIISNILPARFNLSDNWTSCTKDRDCIILPDCCGWDYGFKYAVNEWSAGEYEHYKSDFCGNKDHRSGCGWSTPKTTQARCIDSKCTLSYGGFVPDSLQDGNFTYTYDWMKRLDDINYTVVDGGSFSPDEEYDPYGYYTPDNGSMRGNMQ